MIMEQPPVIDDPLLMGVLHAESIALDRERMIWHTTRGVIGALRNAGLQVHDFVTDLHPEWVTPQEP